MNRLSNFNTIAVSKQMSDMKIGHNYYVYLLICSDNSFYTGVTNNLERRLWEHSTGQDANSYTYGRRPVKLAYCEHYGNIRNAIAREKQIKGWSRAKKAALIREDWECLSNFSRQRLKRRF